MLRPRVGTVFVILTAVGLYVLVCRLIRRHYRSMARISDSLMRGNWTPPPTKGGASGGQEARGTVIEQDLQSLRVADAGGELTKQWNALIDLVDELSVEASRATASTELKEVLERSRRGELADVVNAIPDGLLYVVERDRLAFANATARRLMEIEEEGTEGRRDEGTKGRRDEGTKGRRDDSDECTGGQPCLAATRQGSASPVRLSELAVGETGKRIIEQISTALGANGSYNSISAVVEADNGASSFRVRTFSLSPRLGRGVAQGSCVVMITDISQQVRADKASEEFVSQVTHELRTPLTNIRAYAETLSSGVFDDPKVITECYNVITKETRRLSRLIEDMLSVSQLEVGTIQIHVDEVDLRALLSDSVQDLRGIADDRQIDMQLSLPSKLPEFEGDRDKLAVVINNLLGNALKYTPEGGSVLLGCKAGADEVLITVKDTGMGIDQADHERIFEKFQRGSSAEVEQITGTGIGLTTAREIVRRHGGDIQVMSVKGEGATFIVSLPRKGTELRATEELDRDPVGERSPMGRG